MDILWDRQGDIFLISQCTSLTYTAAEKNYFVKKVFSILLVVFLLIPSKNALFLIIKYQN